MLLKLKQESVYFTRNNEKTMCDEHKKLSSTTSKCYNRFMKMYAWMKNGKNKKRKTRSYMY